MSEGAAKDSKARNPFAPAYPHLFEYFLRFLGRLDLNEQSLLEGAQDDILHKRTRDVPLHRAATTKQANRNQDVRFQKFTCRLARTVGSILV